MTNDKWRSPSIVLRFGLDRKSSQRMTPSPTPSPAAQLNSEKPGWIDALILAGVLFMMLLGINHYGLYEPHEAHFAGVGREMVTRHDWVTPHLNGAPYLNKPPLMYWLIATSFTICRAFTGGAFTEFAARLPLALLAWSGCVLAWNWARQLWGLRAGRTAAVMLMVTAGWYLFGHQLMIEMLLCVLYLASMYLLWKAILEPEKRWRWAVFYLAISLNVMAKGPVGLVFVGMGMLLYMAVRREWGLLRRCHLLMGAAICLGICAPWLTLMEQRNPGYLHYAVMSENINRALGKRWPPDFDVVKVNIPIFILAALVWLVPWSLFTPQVFSFAWKNALLRTDSGAADTSVSRPVSDGILLLGIAALVPILFFIPIPARLVYYQLPSLPPFIILAAGWWSVCETECYARGRRAGAIALLVVGAAVASTGFWLPQKLSDIPDLAAAPPTISYVDNIAFLLGASLLSGGAFLLWRKVNLSIAATAGFVCGACLYIVTGFATFDPVRSSKRTVEAITDKVGPECIWISEGSKEIGASAGIAFYLGTDAEGRSRSVFIVNHPETDTHRAPPKFPGPPPPYAISQEKLDEIWQSKVPAVFVSDFQRKSDIEDPIQLPKGEANLVPNLRSGHRRIYANSAAWERLKP